MEVEQRLEVEAPFGHGSGRRRHDRPQAQSAGKELARPEHGDAGTLEPAGTVEDEVGEKVVVERQEVRDLLAEEGTNRLPGPRAAP